MKAEIFDVTYSGNGVGKIDDKIVFVPYVDIGEVVDVDILKDKSSYSNCELKKVVTPSKNRILPKCPYFAKCGGCNFQFLTYERELELKKLMLKNELKKVGFDREIEITPSEDRFNYRNKIKLTYKNGRLGFNLIKSHDFLEIKNCLLADEKISKAIKDVEEFLKDNRFKFLENVTFRSVENDVLITFLFSKDENLILDKNLQQYSIFKGIGSILESDKTKIKLINGEKENFKLYDNIKFPVDAQAFLQVNDKIAKLLYQKIIENTEGKKVINAYSGQGLLTLLLAKKCGKVIGIEYQKSSHRIAEKLKTQNIKNYCGKVEDVLPKLLENEKFDAIVLDPAREGCEKVVLDVISKSCIPSVIYISCNFPSLVRDIKRLSNYKIDQVEIFDMFPCTKNLEVFTKLSRR